MPELIVVAWKVSEPPVKIYGEYSYVPVERFISYGKAIPNTIMAI